MGYTQGAFMSMFLALFAILVLGVIFKYTLRKSTLAVRQIPLMVVAALLLILEIIKQVYHIVNGDWATWFIPLHFCSYFLVWYTVALFTRGKIRQTMYFCSLTGGILVSILLFAAPSMILHSATENFWNSFDHFHTYVYHMGVVAYWIWMLMLKVYQPQRQHIYQAIILHTAFFFVTIAGAHIFHTNFTNVLTSDIGIMENLRTSAGQFPYTVVLLMVGIVAVSVVSSLTYFIMNKLYRHLLNKDSLTVE